MLPFLGADERLPFSIFIRGGIGRTRLDDSEDCKQIEQFHFYVNRMIEVAVGEVAKY